MFWRFGPNRKISGKNLLSLCLLINLCWLSSGCEMKMPWDKPKPKAEAPAEGADQAEEGAGQSEEPVVVNELDFLPPAMKKLPFEEVSIPLKDGMVIYGRLYDPSQKLANEDDSSSDSAKSSESNGDGADNGEYKGPKYPLIILLHGLDRDHTVWSDLPASLVKAGYSVFAMDLRGHGKSTTTTHKNRVTWRFFEPDQWQLLPKDVDQIIQHFQKDEDHPQIDGKTVGLIGEKLGANVAVFSGRDMLPVVKAMVLLSPGLNYKGLIPSQAIIDYTNPALLITTQDEQYSYQSTERLYNWLLGLKALQIYKKIGDGSDMISHQSAVGDNITEWLTHQMPSPAMPKPAEPKPDSKSEPPQKSDEKPADSDVKPEPEKKVEKKSEKTNKNAQKNAKIDAKKPQKTVEKVTSVRLKTQ